MDAGFPQKMRPSNVRSGESQNRKPEPPRAICARCGAAFACDPGGDCWCMHVDARLPMPPAGETCLCADCLRAAAANGRPVSHRKDRPQD
jgi:hypothetical protein